MVPKFYGPRGATKRTHGMSFKHLASYLLHDEGKAETQGRVAWTHTLNLADDHPASAVNEMLWTCRAAEELKREAGIKPGGRPLERPVRHFSLNWHPSETPSKAHMIEAVESFLAHMKWHEHQALIVCHTDKAHRHVHVMLNAVHPETGCALHASFERHRAQEWAKEYERERGLIFCEQRLKPRDHRTPSPTRATWQQLRGYERDDARADQMKEEKNLDYFARNDAGGWKAQEWKFLKEHQKAERLRFIAEGKYVYGPARQDVYREVREEFRAKWADYYRGVRSGADKQMLADRKAELLSRQKAELDRRRDEVCTMLRNDRDEQKAELLELQRDQRRFLREQQDQGLRTFALLNVPYSVRFERDIHYESYLPSERPAPVAQDMRRAAEDATAPAPGRNAQRSTEIALNPPKHPPQASRKVRDPLNTAGGLGLGALGALATIGERLFDGFFSGGNGPAQPQREPEPPTHQDDETAEATSAQQSRTESAATEEAKIINFWEQRHKRRRERD